MILVRDLAAARVQKIGAICYNALRANWTPDSEHVVSGTPLGDSPGPCRVVVRSAKDGRVVRMLAKYGQAGAISPEGKWIYARNAESIPSPRTRFRQA